MKITLLILIVALGVGCGGKKKESHPREVTKVYKQVADSIEIYIDGVFRMKMPGKLDTNFMINFLAADSIYLWKSDSFQVIGHGGLTSSTCNDSLVYIVDTGLYAPNAHPSTTGGAIDAYMIYLDSIYGRWAMRDTMQIFGHAYDDDALNYIRACGADSILGKYNWRQLDNGDIEYFDKKWIKVVPRQQRGNAIMSIPGNNWPSPTYPLKGSEDSGVQFYPIEIYDGKEWRTIPYDHYYDTAVIDDWYTYGRQQDRDSANYYMKQYIKKDTTKKHQP